MGQVLPTQACCCSHDSGKDIGKAQVVTVSAPYEEQDIPVVKSGLGIVSWPKAEDDSEKRAHEGMAIKMLSEIDEAFTNAGLPVLDEKSEIVKKSRGERLENLVDVVLAEAEDSIFKCCCSQDSSVTNATATIVSVEPGSEREYGALATHQDKLYMQQLESHQDLKTDLYSLYSFEGETDADCGNTTAFSVESVSDVEEEVSARPHMQQKMSNFDSTCATARHVRVFSGEHAVDLSKQSQVYPQRAVAIRQVAVRSNNESDGSLRAPLAVGSSNASHGSLRTPVVVRASSALDGSLRAPVLLDGSLRAAVAASEHSQSRCSHRDDAVRDGELLSKVAELDGSLLASPSGHGTIVRMITTTYPGVIKEIRSSTISRVSSEEAQSINNEKSQVERQRSAIYVNKKKTKSHLESSASNGNYTGDD